MTPTETYAFAMLRRAGVLDRLPVGLVTEVDGEGPVAVKWRHLELAMGLDPGESGITAAKDRTLLDRALAIVGPQRVNA